MITSLKVALRHQNYRPFKLLIVGLVCAISLARGLLAHRNGAEPFFML